MRFGTSLIRRLAVCVAQAIAAAMRILLCIVAVFASLAVAPAYAIVGVSKAF